VEIYQHIDEFSGVKNPIVTIGTFDGVHLGHQKIFELMKRDAEKHDGETVVITFYPHPRLVLHSDSKNLKFINTQKRKIELLERSGVDHLIIINFTREFSRMNSATFIKEYLVDKIKTKKLIIGYDHHFGKNRLGDFSTLYDLGHRHGFAVEKLAVQNVENVAISSTKIRKALNEGKIKKANLLLGYEYSITGVVVTGNKIGRTIGFPTANIDLEDEYKLVTANGVYACRVKYEGKVYLGMGNIGVRPTVNHSDLTIEVNIFDFDKEIYDESITIFFVDRIRDEIKFENLSELRDQLKKDEVTVLALLK
jgi:riboflavin kinase / FMN adenylyltransferase